MSTLEDTNPATHALPVRTVSLPANAREVELVYVIDDDHEFDLLALGACLIGGYVLDGPTVRFTCWVQDGVTSLAMNAPAPA